MTVNFADVPVFLGDAVGEIHRSVDLGKSPLPTHQEKTLILPDQVFSLPGLAGGVEEGSALLVPVLASLG